MIKAVVMKDVDNVATVVEEINPDSEVSVDVAGKQKTIIILGRVAFGHKFAIKDIENKALVKKYGEVIGVATKDIKAGQHVHVHNLESTRGRGDK